MMPLPLTVIAGYLGAGKTTLINRLLAEDHGLRVLVIVNDFGTINIDATLLESSEDDTIALTNGCVCCNLGDDLNAALDQALDRRPRPDHVIVEASGIADPTVIAAAAIAEPELSYGGIVTLADGLNLPTLLKQSDVAEQVTHQIRAADLVLVTKTDRLPEELPMLTHRTARLLDDAPLAPLLFDFAPNPQNRNASPHPTYTRWQHDSTQTLSRAALGEKLENRPQGLYRLKGTILTDDGSYEVHIVGQYVSARRRQAGRTQLVGLGPTNQISTSELEEWWTAPLTS